MYKNIFRNGGILIFTLLCSCIHQEPYVKPSVHTTKNVPSHDERKDYSQFTAKIRKEWIKNQLHDYLLDLRKNSNITKRKIDIFPLAEKKDHDAKSLLCHQRLIEIRKRAGSNYLNSLASTISKKIDEPGQNISQLLSDLVNDVSMDIAYEISEKPKESCESNFLGFYKTAYVKSKAPDNLVAAVEAEATLYGLLKEVVITLDQDALRTKNSLELSSILSESITQKEVNDAIQTTNDMVITNSKMDKRYAINRFRKAYSDMNIKAKELKPTQISACKAFFAAKEVNADSSDFTKCADALFAKLEVSINQTLAEASKYDYEANMDPTALIRSVKNNFGDIKKLAQVDWKNSTHGDLVSTVIRVGRFANALNNKLVSDDVKKAMDELAKELKKDN